MKRLLIAFVLLALPAVAGASTATPTVPTSTPTDTPTWTPTRTAVSTRTKAAAAATPTPNEVKNKVAASHVSALDLNDQTVDMPTPKGSENCTIYFKNQEMRYVCATDAIVHQVTAPTP